MNATPNPRLFTGRAKLCVCDGDTDRSSAQENRAQVGTMGGTFVWCYPKLNSRSSLVLSPLPSIQTQE